MKKLLIAMGIIMGIAVAGNAAVISSSTVQDGPLPVLRVMPNESLTFQSSGTYTGDIFIEKSVDAINWTTIGISTENQVGVAYSGTIYNGGEATNYRFNVTTVTAGTIITVLADRDDVNSQIINKKKQPTVYFYDDTVRLKSKLLFQPTSTTDIALSSMTAIDETLFVNTFNVITSTGGAILMGSTPTIETSRQSDGAMLIIYSSTDTVTFQDNGTLSGSNLELGASTRALGVGDILKLIYYNDKWYEIGFYNN